MRRIAPATAFLLAASALSGCALGGALPPGPRQSRAERNASGLLKQLYTLQMTYQAYSGEFASTTEQLKTVGWEDDNLRSGYYPWFVHHQSWLCMAVLPGRPSLLVASIDGAGRLYRGPYCGRLR